MGWELCESPTVLNECMYCFW